MVALLSQRVHGRALPWVELVRSDLRLMYAKVSRCAQLGNPDTQADVWVAYVVQCPEAWRQDVSTLHFSESVLDRGPVADHSNSVRPFACPECHSAFGTERQLKSHVQMQHQVRALQRFHAPASGTCASCGWSRN